MTASLPLLLLGRAGADVAVRHPGRRRGQDREARGGAVEGLDLRLLVDAAMRPDLPMYIAAGEMDPLHGQLALVHALVDRYASAGLSDVTPKGLPGGAS